MSPSSSPDNANPCIWLTSSLEVGGFKIVLTLTPIPSPLLELPDTPVVFSHSSGESLFNESPWPPSFQPNERAISK